MLTCVFSLFSLFDFKMSLFSNDRKKTWTAIKEKRQWWMEINRCRVSFRHSKKKNRFFSSWLTLIAIVEHYFGFFIQYDAGWFFSFYEKQFTTSVCSFNVIWNNFLRLPCGCMINAAIGDGKITCHLLLFLPFQFIQQMSVFPKLRESFLSLAQHCYWYHENREWRHFMLQKKNEQKMTFSTTNKSRFFI